MQKNSRCPCLFRNFRKCRNIISRKFRFWTTRWICITKLRCWSRIITKNFGLCKISRLSMLKNYSIFFWWLRKGTSDVFEWFTISRFDMHQSWLFFHFTCCNFVIFWNKIGVIRKKNKTKIFWCHYQIKNKN